MSDSILNRFTSKHGDNTQEDGSDANGAEDFGSFGWMRGQRDRAIMLELRKKTGSILAIGYGWIERIEFEPSKITLAIGECKIVISGRNLNAEARPQVRLFQGLTKHKVSFIKEADRSSDLYADKNAVVIESIVW
jgi:hypothetical protein